MEVKLFKWLEKNLKENPSFLNVWDNAIDILPVKETPSKSPYKKNWTLAPKKAYIFSVLVFLDFPRDSTSHLKAWGA